MLALLSVTLRVLTPSGYMFAPDSPSGYALCTSQGIQEPDREPGETDAAAGMKDAPCAFAGVGAVDVPPVSPGVSSPIGDLSRHGVYALQETLRPGLGLAAPPPPSTGPPLS
ncbi:hypothetical protein [Phenylobacterium parvum]|uniref:DUF2946 domain-containing protein n=1 Tax=Phenylobacterium parvum TaxID=2201350 RepID=A0A2Z3HRQ6_9CAUL|nr:hypothetical protein [Phenylobacterium parvum]AWM77932.1 hypothetical protein HYN04_09275 [Phenylobacterium parvum]